MRIIALGHRARQGKDTAGREIVKFAGANGIYAKQYAFADSLKVYCRVAFGMTDKNSRLLQTVGTDLYRDHVRRDFWVQILGHQLREEQPDLAIITDLRYPDEWEFVKSANGITIKVTRLINNEEFLPTDRDPNHRSETALLDDKYWDYKIFNDGDLVDLSEKVRNLSTYLFTEPK